MSDLLVVLLAHTATHIVDQLDTVCDRVLVLFAEAREAHETAAHNLAVKWSLHFRHSAQTLSEVIKTKRPITISVGIDYRMKSLTIWF